MPAFFAIGIFELLILLAVLGLFVGGIVFVVVAITTSSRRAGGAGNPNLFPCPDCHRHVSRLAKSCPQCGRPLSAGGPT